MAPRILELLIGPEPDPTWRKNSRRCIWACSSARASSEPGPRKW